MLNGDAISFYPDSILDYGDPYSWFYHGVSFCDDVGLVLFKEGFPFYEAIIFCPFNDDGVLFENDFAMLKCDLYIVLVNDDVVLYYGDPITLWYDVYIVLFNDDYVFLDYDDPFAL